MRERNATLLYALVQAAIWGLYGVLFSYANRYLLAGGLTNTQAGLVLAVSTAAALGAQPVITALSDRGRVTVRGVMMLTGGVISVAMVGLLLCRGLWPVVVIYCAACAALQILPAFGNALGMETLQSGIHMNYGLGRGAGAVAFGIGAQVAVPLIDRSGLSVVPGMSLFFAVLLLVSALFYPTPARTGEKTWETPTGLREFFARNRSFTVFLAGAMLLYLGHNTLNNCMYQIAVYKGDASAQGTALLLAALLELPAMFGFSLFLRVGRCEAWLRVAGAAFTGKILLILLLPGAAGLLWAQLAHMLGYGAFTMASVYYAAEVIPERDVVKGQTWLGLTNTIGCLAAHFLGGALIDAFGVGAMLWVCAGISAAGAAIVWFSAGAPEKGTEP